MQPSGVRMVWLLRADYTTRMVEEVCETELDAREAEQRHNASGAHVQVEPAAQHATPLPDTCHFCGRDRQQVKLLFTGPVGTSAGICEGCVESFHTIVSATLARPSASQAS